MGQAISGSDEPALLRRIRHGEDEAFGTLFENHVSAVRRLARGIASDRSEAEDITAETFFRVLQALRRGNGPKDNVRAYLLTVARRVAWEWHGSRRDVPVADDELASRAGAGADPQSRTAEAALITRAFSSLPERWRSVLWQTEVEGEQPAVVAPHFGLSPNATAALARRARIGLRAAYLQAHLAADNGSRADGCKAVLDKLGGFTAGSVAGAEARKIEAHLGTCSSCRSTHDELREVCSSLRSHAGAVILLVPASGLALAVTGAGVGTTGTAGAAGAGGTAVASGIGGTVTAMGINLKIGLAVASTAAVGAVGMAASPLADDHGRTLGLPSDGGSVELRIAEPNDGVSDRAAVSIVEPAAFDFGEAQESGSERSSRAVSDTAVPGPTEYVLPPGLELAGEANRARGARGRGTELPAEAGADKGADQHTDQHSTADDSRGNPGSPLGKPVSTTSATSAKSARSAKSSKSSKSTASSSPSSTPSDSPSSTAPPSETGSGTADPPDEPERSSWSSDAEDASSTRTGDQSGWCRWRPSTQQGLGHADGCRD